MIHISRPFKNTSQFSNRIDTQDVATQLNVVCSIRRYFKAEHCLCFFPFFTKMLFKTFFWHIPSKDVNVRRLCWPKKMLRLHFECRLTHVFPLSLSLSLSLSLTHTHTYIHIQKHTHSHALTHTHKLLHALTRTHTRTYTHSHTLARTLNSFCNNVASCHETSNISKARQREGSSPEFYSVRVGLTWWWCCCCCCCCCLRKVIFG